MVVSAVADVSAAEAAVVSVAVVVSAAAGASAVAVVSLGRSHKTRTMVRVPDVLVLRVLSLNRQIEIARQPCQ